jgi:Uma2 family endonuclease
MTTDILKIARPVTHLPPPIGTHWSVATYEQLPNDGVRYEIVEGELHMAPAPVPEHQSTSGYVLYFLMQQIQLGGYGRVFSAPIDVELAFDTIVQPDIVVVLNNSAAAITAHRIVGPPNLVVEITSPSTTSYDRREKRDAYAMAGIPEYWIVDPASQSVELLVLDGATYRADAVYRGQAVIPSTVLPNWDVSTQSFFGLE